MKKPAETVGTIIFLLCGAALVIWGANAGGIFCTAIGCLFLVGAALYLLHALTRERDALKHLDISKERTIQHLEEELSCARKELISTIADYRSTLTHGLRMPIAVIQGSAELLLNDMIPEPEAQKEYLEKILQRCLNMTELLGRNTEIGDPQSLHPRLEETDLVTLTRSTADDISTVAMEQNICVRVLSPLNRLVIQADHFLLEWMLYYILENAVKYMGRPGNVTLRIQQQDNNALLLIQDDGLGMDEEDVQHIFEKGYQGKNRKIGQGQGMFLVKQIVDAHRGTVEVSSRPGSGLGVRIVLPMEQGLPSTEEAEK